MKCGASFWRVDTENNTLKANKKGQINMSVYDLWASMMSLCKKAIYGSHSGVCVVYMLLLILEAL